MSNSLDKFLRKRKSAKKNVTKYFDVYQSNLEDLEFYNQHGVLRDQVSLHDGIERKPWEILDSELRIPLNYFEIEVEASFVGEGFLPKKRLATCLDYGLIHSAITYYRQKLAAERYKRELLGIVAPDIVFNLAIAIILTRYDNAKNLFEFLAQAYSRGWLNRSNSHMTDFIILLYAKYCNEPLSATVADFSYQHIVNDWDTADPEKAAHYLTQLCDDQVAQVAAPPSKCFFEFDNLNWQFIPYPALMLLALRKARGIKTPAIEHPAFGNLTAIDIVEGEDVVDEVFTKLVDKLERQGFDMSSIFI
jgi:hypothetical protein